MTASVPHDRTQQARKQIYFFAAGLGLPRCTCSTQQVT